MQHCWFCMKCGRYKCHLFHFFHFAFFLHHHSPFPLYNNGVLLILCVFLSRLFNKQDFHQLVIKPSPSALFGLCACRVTAVTERSPRVWGEVHLLLLSSEENWQTLKEEVLLLWGHQRRIRSMKRAVMPQGELQSLNTECLGQTVLFLAMLISSRKWKRDSVQSRSTVCSPCSVVHGV